MGIKGEKMVTFSLGEEDALYGKVTSMIHDAIYSKNMDFETRSEIVCEACAMCTVIMKKLNEESEKKDLMEELLDKIKSL